MNRQFAKTIRTPLLASTASVLLLAGCGGGGGALTPAAPSSRVETTTSTSTTTPKTSGAMTEAQWLADTEFRATSSAGASKADLLNAEAAYAKGYSGAGETIAILDAGFRSTHDEFQSKKVTRYDSAAAHDHGTHVAAIAAAARDDAGIMGIAYGANLHLASIYANSGQIDTRKWAAATRDAAAKGAAAQNNSWRFDREVPLEDALGVKLDQGSVEAALAKLTKDGRTYVQAGGDSADWADWLGALRDFQKTGVIVKSLSNDVGGKLRSAKSANLHAALPSFDSRLMGAWLTVANVARNADGTAELWSAPCAQTAEYCLSADGVDVYSAVASGDGDYGLMTGTSMAAPQISGAVAILAQAFPNLTPSEIAARLLATADNSFFTTDGATTFAGGVTHGYSATFGHGAADLRAALSPVGTLGAATESTIDAPRVALSKSVLMAGAASGDALARALATESIAAFDQMGASFEVSAASRVAQSGAAALSSRLAGFGHAAPRAAAADGGRASFATDGAQAAALRAGALSASLTLAPDLGDAMGYAVATPGHAGLLADAHDAKAARLSYGLGESGRLSLGGFTANTAQGDLTGGGAELALRRGTATLSLGLETTAQARGVAGFGGEGAFGLNDGRGAMARIGGSVEITSALRLYGAYSTGAADARGEGLVSGVSGLRLEAFTVGFEGENAFAEGDLWRVSLSQPARVVSGKASLRLADGRDSSGAISYRTVEADLTPSGRELALTGAYSTPLSDRAKIALEATWKRDAGHVQGAQGVEAFARFSLNF